MNDFQDQVVFIAGAGRGAGRALAEAFAAHGAKIAANDVTPINLTETVRRIRANGGIVKDLVFDIAKKIPVQTMIEQVLTEWKRIDILVNCAGVMPQGALLDIDEWDWHRTLDINLGGPFLLMQIIGRAMREQGGGVIINLAASENALQSLSQQAAYIASKTGLIGLTLAAARELAADHIRVNVVCPDQIPTETTLFSPISPEQANSQALIDQVLFLCSPAANSITGQSFVIHSDLES